MDAKQLFTSIVSDYGSGIFGSFEEANNHISSGGAFPILVFIPIPANESVSFVADRFSISDEVDVYCLQNMPELDFQTSVVFDPAKAGEVKLLKSFYKYINNVTVIQSLTEFQKFSDGVISSGYKIKVKNSPFCP